MAHVPPARAQRLSHRASLDPGRAHGGLDEGSASLAPGGLLRCSGWAWPFDDERVRRVEIVVDGAPVGLALPSLRPDIAEALDLPAAALSGFEAELYLAHEPGSIRLTALIHGMDGGTWSPAEQTVSLDPAAPAAARAGDGETGGAEPPGAPPARGAERELQRRRLGYDPWHRVVLLEGSAGLRSSAAALAALDEIAERVPNLELLIAGVLPEEPLADLLRRAIAATALEDRVTVPRGDEQPPSYWRSVTDLAVDPSKAYDLAAMIESLTTAASGGRGGA